MELWVVKFLYLVSKFNNLVICMLNIKENSRFSYINRAQIKVQQFEKKTISLSQRTIVAKTCTRYYNGDIVIEIFYNVSDQMLQQYKNTRVGCGNFLA